MLSPPSSQQKKEPHHDPWETNELSQVWPPAKGASVPRNVVGKRSSDSVIARYYNGHGPDGPRLEDVYVLIYEVKGWLQVTPTNLEKPYLKP